MKKITYYAANYTMGDIGEQQCNYFRRWAESELRSSFPNHKVSVRNELRHHHFVTDDYKRYEEIANFCSRLKNKCPWDDNMNL